MSEELSKTLKLFSDKAEELRSNLDFFRNLGIKLNWKESDGNVNISAARPDEKTLKAFLLDFRHFYSQKSPINFLKVCNLIARKHLGDKELLAKIEESRRVWGLLLKRENAIPIIIDEKKLASGDDLLKLFINGELFHLDDDKNSELSSIKNTPAYPFAVNNFIDLVQNLSEIILWFNNNVVSQLTLGDEK